MKVLRRILWLVAGLVGMTVALALGVTLWVSINAQLGWKDLPDEAAPQYAEVFDNRFADVSEPALALLEAMRREEGVPGATAAVAIDGQLVWVAGVGWADLAANTPATPQTVFRIGSTSKAMTATVMARLTEAGVLNVDDTVAAHVPAPLNPDWAPMTVAQLLSHTAGFPGYEENTDWAGVYSSLRMVRQYDSIEAGLRLVDGSELLFAPGEDFHYSSFDVNLAAFVAEQASGQDYATLLEENVRTPLGLDTPVLADFGAAPDTVSRFYLIREGGQYRSRGQVNVSQRWASGGLYGRSIDLVQVASAWLDEEFISETTREQFWTPMRLSSGEVNEQNYALGWRVNPESTTRFGEAAPVRIVHHGGVSRGAMSWLILYPELGIAVAVNINTQTDEFGDFSSVEPQITRLFAEAVGRTPEGARLPD